MKDGDDPLPLKYVITSKWMTGAPEYSLRLSDWNATPEIGEAAFEFVPPAGARKLSGLIMDDMGQVKSSWE